MGSLRTRSSARRSARPLTPGKLRDARLASLLAAALDYERRPYAEDVEQMVLGAARAWARAERDVQGRVRLVPSEG